MEDIVFTQYAIAYVMYSVTPLLVNYANINGDHILKGTDQQPGVAPLPIQNVR